MAYWLGTCKLNEGDSEAALKAWASVPDDCTGSTRGREGSRPVGEPQLGRYGLAEACLKRAILGAARSERRGQAAAGPRLLDYGRRDQYRRLHSEADAERTHDPSDILLTLWSLDHDPFRSRGSLRHSRKPSNRPQTTTGSGWLSLTWPRVTGRFDEADRWLTRCEHARPDDTDRLEGPA